MASFGWSVGDVIAITTLAWKLYKTCESAGEEFKTLAADVQALQTLLQGVADELQDPGSVVHKAGKSKRQQLVNLIDDCNTDLRDLERYILQYKSLKSAKPRLRDRLRFGIKPISQIRLKLSQHTDNLNLFLAHVNTTSLARLEQASASSAGLLGDIKARLDALCQQVESGQKDASLLDAKSNWVGLKRELVGERVTDRDVTCNRNSIQEYITTWLNATSHHQRTEPGGNRGTTKRTSSMIPWTPMGQIGPLAQPLPSTPMYFPRTATPSIPDLMWECTGRDTPNTDVDFAQSEDTSQCSADVFSSQSFQSSRVTTPDILGTPVERIPSEIAYFSGEKSDCTGTEGIESLIDELDAFALDLSRASTPDAHSSNLGEESTEIQYYDLDQNLEQIHPANTLLHAPGATTLKRRILTRPLALTLEEAFVGGMKKKRIRGRLLPDTNDADTFTIRESTIEVHYPPAARQGLKIEFPGVAIDPDGFIQDLHFIVVWKRHNIFRLEDEDLSCVINITLLESLCGWARKVRTIDGIELDLERHEVTSPTWSAVYPGLGVPVTGKDQLRSNLLIRVNVDYPETISPYQDKVLRHILAPKTELSPRMQLMSQQYMK